MDSKPIGGNWNVVNVSDETIDIGSPIKIDGPPVLSTDRMERDVRREEAVEVMKANLNSDITVAEIYERYEEVTVRLVEIWNELQEDADLHRVAV